MKLSTLLLGIVLLAGVAVLFSYRILQSPIGLTADEGAFAENAVLLSQTGRDENGRFLPVFVLSLNGADWRQPITQYYLAGFFKVFGATVFNLRFSSVVVSMVSAVLLYMISRRYFSSQWALVSAVVLLSAPLMLIQSHMGLDNIMTVPFALAWYWGVWQFYKEGKFKWLFLAGLALGGSFYTYKGMRAVVPVWSLLTLLPIYWRSAAGKKKFQHWVAGACVFGIGLLPFLGTIPLWERLYPGAILGGSQPELHNIYDFVLPWFSSYDPSFLFVTGDVTPWHSTGKHGMMLLASLPLFVIGIYQSFKGDKFWRFITISFFVGPLLYGLINSVHRASRMMYLLPSYALLSTLGAYWLWQQKKKAIVLIIGVLMILNWIDFAKYYWFTYPELTRTWFGDLGPYVDYRAFGKLAREMGVRPVLDIEVFRHDGQSGKFFDAAYIGLNTSQIDLNVEELDTNAIVLSPRKDVPGLENISVEGTKYYYIHRQK